MAGYWPSQFSFCLFMDRDGVEVHKNAKNKEKEPGQYLAILTEQAWSIKEFIMWLRLLFYTY